jgi:hypothetical protein
MRGAVHYPFSEISGLPGSSAAARLCALRSSFAAVTSRPADSPRDLNDLRYTQFFSARKDPLA